MTAPLLVFAWGNRSRGDDALGPLLVEHLRAVLSPGDGVECLDDYQLQIEHALDLVGRRRVLFVDASITCRAPFEATPLLAARDRSVTTHALSPQALLQVYADLCGGAPPPCTLLAIRGERFELGDAPSARARIHLDAALQWARAWLAIEAPRDQSSSGTTAIAPPGRATTIAEATQEAVARPTPCESISVSRCGATPPAHQPRT